MNGDTFSVVNAFFGHEAEGNDAGVYFARHFQVDSDLLPVNKIAYFVFAFIVADAITMSLSFGGFNGQLIEIEKYLGLSASSGSAGTGTPGNGRRA